jgi:hypothetical protein
MESKLMRKIILTIGLVLGFSSSALAQRPHPYDYSKNYGGRVYHNEYYQGGLNGPGSYYGKGSTNYPSWNFNVSPYGRYGWVYTPRYPSFGYYSPNVYIEIYGGRYPRW